MNSNPANPIIGVRSFGSDPQDVAEKASAYIEGLQSAGVLACVKHFPGHGDTDKDSHKELPVINADRQHLESVELYPFEKTLGNGAASVMTAHLDVPALEGGTGRPSSLSSGIVDGILRSRWGFDGIVITDALNMKGVSSNYPSGRAEIEAIKAGNDMLLYSADPETAYREVLRAVKNGDIRQQRIDQSVRRILSAKYRLGILTRRASQTDTSHLVRDSGYSGGFLAMPYDNGKCGDASQERTFRPAGKGPFVRESGVRSPSREWGKFGFHISRLYVRPGENIAG